MKYPLIVFDWDGTILDSAAAIVRAIQAASVDLDLPAPSDAQARHVIGLGLVDALQRAVPELPAARYPEMVARYRAHYLGGDHALSLFEGMRELLTGLQARGHCLAVATGKSRLGLERALDHSGVRHRFTASRCADECHSKPHPQMLLELMDELVFAPEETLMIGDTTHDLLMAREAGVAALGVTYGAHTHGDLLAAGPLACLHSVPELAGWLLQHA